MVQNSVNTPLTSPCSILFQNVNVDKLTESLAQMRDKIGTEVFGPMSEWNRDYKKVQVSDPHHGIDLGPSE